MNEGAAKQTVGGDETTSVKLHATRGAAHLIEGLVKVA
jgi:hypothetical protein